MAGELQRINQGQMDKGKGTQFSLIFLCPEGHRKEANFNKGKGIRASGNDRLWRSDRETQRQLMEDKG